MWSPPVLELFSGRRVVMIYSLVARMETMEAWMALFQETVGKLSPPRIKVDVRATLAQAKSQLQTSDSI